MRRERVVAARALSARDQAPPGRTVPGDGAGGAIRVLRRALDPEIAQTLDALDHSSLPALRLTGDEATVLADLSRGLEVATDMPAWLRVWLVSDVEFLLRLFAEHRRATAFVVRLEAVAATMCPRLHTDNVRFRLVTTYRGAGTEWVAPKDRRLVRNGEPIVPGIIRRMDRGWIDVMRGRKSAAGTASAVLPRSPAVGAAAEARLFLTVDDARDHASSQGGDSARPT